MTLISKEIHWAGQKFEINNGRSMYWLGPQALIVSDLHLGKAAHFRKHGIAVPRMVTESDMERLQHLLNHYKPRKLIIVGDLFHAGTNTETSAFNELLHQYAQLQTILIKGNHDKLTQKELELLSLDLIEEKLIIDDIAFCHDPDTLNKQEEFAICGHIHPGVFIELPTQRIKLPCFVTMQHQCILPAFSLFTGMYVYSNSYDYCYAFDQKGIYTLCGEKSRASI